MGDETRPDVLPRWATTAAAVDVDSPSSGKLDAGWVAGEAPPHDWFNFLLQNNADWIRHIDRMLTALGAFNWERVIGEGASGEFENSSAADRDMRGADFDAATGIWVAAGGTDGCQASYDDARTFVAFDTGMASAIGLQDAAVGGSSSAVCVGTSATAYQRASILSGSWGTVTLPGIVTSAWSVAYDVLNARYIVVGTDSGSDPYVATSDNSTGTAFTDRSSGVPAGLDNLSGLRSVAVSDDGVVVVSAFDATTKVGWSDDGGETFSLSTTTLDSGVYDLAWSPALRLFIAARVQDNTSNHVYTSPDGDTWTARFTGTLFDDESITDGHGVATLGHLIMIAGEISGKEAIAVSSDRCETWTTHLSEDQSAGRTYAVSSRGGGRVLRFYLNTATGTRSLRIAPG